VEEAEIWAGLVEMVLYQEYEEGSYQGVLLILLKAMKVLRD